MVTVTPPQLFQAKNVPVFTYPKPILLVNESQCLWPIMHKRMPIRPAVYCKRIFNLEQRELGVFTERFSQLVTQPFQL